jgi:hypothetical protein
MGHEPAGPLKNRFPEASPRLDLAAASLVVLTSMRNRRPSPIQTRCHLNAMNQTCNLPHSRNNRVYYLIKAISPLQPLIRVNSPLMGEKINKPSRQGFRLIRLIRGPTHRAANESSLWTRVEWSVLVLSWPQGRPRQKRDAGRERPQTRKGLVRKAKKKRTTPPGRGRWSVASPRRRASCLSSWQDSPRR